MFPQYIHTVTLPDDLLVHVDHIHDTLTPPPSSRAIEHLFLNQHPSPSIQYIRSHPFWKEMLCTRDGVDILPIPEMDELYHTYDASDLTPDLGTYGNFAPHVDGMFPLPGFAVYRVLVPLTSHNTITQTCLQQDNTCLHLNRGQVFAFDFNRTKHWVQSTSSSDTPIPRTLLKLHFLVYDEKCPDWYVQWMRFVHIQYLNVSRYIMRTGTNPSTFYEYFIGVFAKYFTILGNHPVYRPLLLVYLLTTLVLLPVRFWYGLGMAGLLLFSWVGYTVYVYTGGH